MKLFSNISNWFKFILVLVITLFTLASAPSSFAERNSAELEVTVRIITNQLEYTGFHIALYDENNNPIKDKWFDREDDNYYTWLTDAKIGSTYRTGAAVLDNNDKILMNEMLGSKYTIKTGKNTVVYELKLKKSTNVPAGKICEDADKICDPATEVCTAVDSTLTKSRCVKKGTVIEGDYCGGDGGAIVGDACGKATDGTQLVCHPDSKLCQKSGGTASNSCEELGENKVVGGKKEYTCKPKCETGETLYDKKNSSCITGICCSNDAIHGKDALDPKKSSSGSTSPTPTPPTEGIGYCGDDSRTQMIPAPAGSTPSCTKTEAEWVKRTANPDLTDNYCKYATGGLQPYFYKCTSAATGTPIKTPTPTPFTPATEGAACIPSQGPWQCAANFYCTQSCNPATASCTTGKCCLNGKVWNGTINSCVPPAVTPIPTTPTTAPTPVTTTGACNDVIVTASGSISQICTQGAQCATGDTPNAGGHEACSQFYGGVKTGYVCCQKPLINTGAAGSSCSVTGKQCDTTKNTSSGTNIQCTGCGGYCIKPSSSEPASCQSI